MIDIRGGFQKYFKQSPITLFNNSSYGDRKYSKDIYNIRGLISTIESNYEENKVSHKKLNILTVMLTPGDPRPFEVRYWMRLHNRNFELFDFVVMHRTAYMLLKSNNFDFIVFRVYEKNENIKGFPYNNFERTINESLDFVSRFHFFISESTTYRKEMYNLLYSKYDKYEFVSKIPAEYGYFWQLYKKKKEDDRK